MIDHIYLANHQNELHAKALLVLRFGGVEQLCYIGYTVVASAYRRVATNEQPV